VLFVKDEKGTWSNVQGASMNFEETASGYEITLDNGNKEMYDYSGKLIEIDKGDLVISLEYRGHKLIKVSDNLEHTLQFKYKKSLLQKIINYDGTAIQYK